MMETSHEDGSKDKCPEEEGMSSALMENEGSVSHLVPSKTGFFQEEGILKEEHVDDHGEGVVEEQANPTDDHHGVCPGDFVVVQEGSVETVKGEESQLCDTSDGYSKMEKERKAKTFQCEHCAWVCNSLSNLKKHRMIHTGERPHTCPECNKTFRQIHHLKDHIRTHTGERPFMCNECGSTFAQRSSLNVHKRKHTGIKPHVCTICDHATYEKEHMVIHMRTHTGEKPYQCDECGQTFSTMTRLKFHIMIHTGERRYACEECGARFREKATLQKHRGVHLTRGPFPCKVCGKEFPRLASLSLHRRIHEQQVYPLTDSRMSTDQVAPEIDSETADHYIEISNEVDNYAKKEGILTSSCAYESIPQVEDSGGLASSQEKTMYLNDMEEDPVENQKMTQNVYPERPENVILESPAIDSFSNNETVVHTESESQSVISIAHPDQVQKALETGTVWETHQQNGEEILVIIPPSLADKEITLVSNQNRVEDRVSEFPNSATPVFHVTQNQSEMVQDYPMIQEEIQEKVQQNHPHILREEPNNGVQTYPMGLQEQIHDDNSGLLVWDDGLDPVTEVTYVIEEGASDPIMIHQDQTHFVHGSEGTEVTRKRKKTKEIWLMEGSERHPEKIKNQRTETGGSVIVKTKKKRQVDKKVRVRKVYDCKQCGKACKTASNYNTHMRMHTGERPYFCGICGMGFKQIPHLRSHIRTHTGEKPYTCPICNASFTQTSRLNIHKKKCSKDTPFVPKKPKVEPACKVRNFYCKICDKTFIDECFKKDHMKMHMEANMFSCEICGMTYKNKVSFEKHKLLHTNDNCVCELCGETFHSKASLNFHKMSHHKSSEVGNTSGMVISVKIGEEKDFVVINPSIKNAQSDSGSDYHIKTEAIEIAEADNCPVKREIIQITDADGTVKSEVLSVGDDDCSQFSDFQGPEIVKPVTDCEAKVESLDSFMGDVPQGEQQLTKAADLVKEETNTEKYKAMFDEQGRKVFVCKVCDKAFLQSSNLLSHMRMHTGERPYKCNLCKLAFRQITHLKDHMHTHTGVRAFKCGICEMAFSQRSAARRHIKTVHDRNADVVKIGNVYSVRGSLPNKSSDSVVMTDELKQITNMKMKNGKPPEKVFKTCDKCDKKYPASYMKIHLRCHSDERPFSCNECSQSFKQKAHLLSHKLRHTGEKPYVCRICSTAYTHPFKLKEHMKKCTKEENSCDKTGKGIESTEESQSEVKNVKSEGNKDYACNCGASFKRQILLTNHRRKCKVGMDADFSIAVNDEEISCNDKSDDEIGPKYKIRAKRKRGSQVKSDESLKNVTESKHPPQQKQNLKENSSGFSKVCEECGMVFRRTSALLFHQKMSHNKSSDEWTYGYSEEASVKEEYIEKDEEDIEELQGIHIKREDPTFKKDSKESLQKENTDVADVPEKTPQKGRRATKGKYSIPTNILEEEKKENVAEKIKRKSKIQQCPVCNKVFKNVTELTSHVETCEDVAIDSQTTTKKPQNSTVATEFEKNVDINCDGNKETVNSQYPCKLCGQTFTRSSKLKHHLNMWCKGMKRESNL